MTPSPLSVRIIGPGRAGTALARALATAGWRPPELVERGGDVRHAAVGVDLLVLTVPDAEIPRVAAIVEPDPSTVVAHLAGSHGVEVLAPHPRRAALHPLTPLPGAAVGARRLRGATWAVSGDLLARRVVAALEGRAIDVRDADRTAYHAAATIASNHLVALLGQVERVAATAGVPLQAYLDLVRATVANVAELGARAALTGPVARGDEATVERHLAALDPAERPAYQSMAEQARMLVLQRAGGAP